MAKVLIIEIPYGKALVLPAELSGFLGTAQLVEQVNYDRDKLRFAPESLTFSLVDAERIQPEGFDFSLISPAGQPMPAPEIPPAPSTIPNSDRFNNDSVSSSDIPF